MQNFVCEGDRIEIVATSTVKSGDLVFAGQKAAVAVTDAVSGAKFAAMTDGVFTIPKATGAISQGDLLYWDSSAKKLTKTAGANSFVGFAYKDALSADEIVQVLIVDNPESNIADAQADSTATTVAGLVADFNALLAKLRTAKLMATS